MKKLFKLCLFLLSLCLFTNDIHAQENFDISNYSVNMIVHEDGSIDVVEKVDLVYTSYVHGFYRNLPEKYEMDFGKGKETYYFPISDIRVVGDPYESEREDNGIQIRIGDPDKLITGAKSYEISYKIQTRELNLDQDIFYWNLIGQFDCKIYHVDFKIEFPKTIDVSTLEFYSDVTYDLVNNTIIGETKETLHNYESLTMYIELGNDYFDFVEIPNYSIFGIVGCSIVFALFAWLYIRFARQEQVFPVVSFKAPKGLGSAGVGYVIDGAVDSKDVLSMIIDFANRGYLTITDTQDDTILTKVKDMERNNPGYEITFFNMLFNQRDEVSCNDLENEYFGDSISGVYELIMNHFYLKQNQVFSNTSFAIQVFLAIFAGLPAGFISMFAKYAQMGMWYHSVLPLFIIWPIISISMICWIILSKQKYIMKKGSILATNITGIVIMAVGLFITYFYLKNDLISYFFVVFYSIAIAYMISTSGKRTKKGNEWLGEILGLKDFILQAEQERLEMLVHDDPKYFYHILPYAYVLNISDTWSKKFERINISQPDWYSSYDNRTFNTIYWNTRFTHTMSHLSSAAHSFKPVETQSGGFSSSSGGGFSGGGFGGGSGGSW